MEPVILINHKTLMTKGSQTQNNKQHTQYVWILLNVIKFKIWR